MNDHMRALLELFRKECIAACKKTQHGYVSGAPDWQGGCEACIEAIKALPVEGE